MIPAPSPGRRATARAARWLAAAVLSGAAALSGTLMTTGAAAAARAGTPVARAAPGLSSTPQRIAINTKNWTGSAGSGSRAPAWYTDGSGVVHLQGAAKQTNGGTPTALQIGTLPRAVWPSHPVYTVVHSFLGTYADLEINPFGEILALPPAAPAVQDFSFVSLEGVTYRPSGKGTPIALNTADWAGGAAGTRQPAWYTDSSGVVHLQGGAGAIGASGPNPNLIGTLPGVATPAHTVYTVVNVGQREYADLAIESNGQIGVIDPRPPATRNYFLVSLEGITFSGSALARNPIPVNTANWSGSAGFGSRPPAWFRDGSGVIHLQGAVTQTSASGTSPNLIGILPAAAAPRHTVYTIVHTYLGTYADLAIEPNGDLALIDPRAPMVKDYTFVSLESITYRR